MTVRRAQPPKPEPTDLTSQILAFTEQGGEWFMLHGWWMAIIAILLLCVWLGLRKLKARYSEIEKLWMFILFFLTKRQMMIPLVINLSRRDKLLDKKTQEKLMAIRQKCREVSFKKSPTARLKLETEVSEILYKYFSKLEKKDQIKAGTKFSKIVQDLEFIDAKLVQLQQVYNHESTRWNQKISVPVLGSILKPFGIKSFEVFN